jgi:hypothetical protein
MSTAMKGVILFVGWALSSTAPAQTEVTTEAFAQEVRALREGMVAEQIQRMLLSDHAIVEFEDLRLRLSAGPDGREAAGLLDRMEIILREEIARTELSLLAATRHSRLGFQFECD